MLFPSTDRVEVGVDEAGRGPLAFDVVAAAVIMPSLYDEGDTLVHKIRDSKKLSSRARDELAEYIRSRAVAYGVGIATAQEIDQHNILNATYIAMHRALDEVSRKARFDHILVDGDRFKPYVDSCPASDRMWVPHTTCVKGDDTHLSIAAASIIAKVTRDNIVHSHLQAHPEWRDMYGFHTNMGYGTVAHRRGIAVHGLTEFHRRSFTQPQQQQQQQ